MIRGICVGIVRDYDKEKRIKKFLEGECVPVIKGYVLKEIKADGEIIRDKTYTFAKEDIIEYIKKDIMDVENLELVNGTKLEFRKVSSKTNNNDEQMKIVNKALMLGLNVRVLSTDCGHKCYLFAKGDDYTLRIPDNVLAPVINPMTKYGIGEELSKIRGKLKVIGGKNVINANNMFEKCRLNVLDLTEFNTESLVEAKDMFMEAHIDEIKFGGLCTMSNVKNMEGMFRCFSNNILDLSELDTGNVQNMENMFENCECNQLYINNFNIGNVHTMKYLFLDASFDELDLSNWVISNVKNTQYIFNNLEVNETVKLSEIDRGNKRLIKFRACWTKEEREANPVNDWYHQYKKAEKYGYDYW